MGRVDQFLAAHVQRGLQPGEAIRWMGLLRHPNRLKSVLLMDFPDLYHEYLTVATDRRLILFTTSIEGLFSVKATPEAGRSHEWWYDEFASVHVQAAGWPVAHSGGKAIVMTFSPRPGCGPAALDPSMPGAYYHDNAKPSGSARRYDMYLTIEDLDANTQMFHQFPGWLSNAVAQHQFPLSPERQAAAGERLAIMAARAAEKRAADAVAAARTAAALTSAGRTGLKLVLIGAMLASLVAGAVVVGFAVEKLDIRAGEAERLREELSEVEDDAVKVNKGQAPVCERPGFESAYVRVVETGSSSGDGTCGGCKVLNLNYAKAPPPKGYKVIQDPVKTFQAFHCPSAETYERAKEGLEKDIERAGRGGDVYARIAGGSLGGLLLGALFGFLAFRKKKPTSALQQGAVAR